MTLALMIVLAAAVAAWVLAPLRGSADRDMSGRGVPAEQDDARSVAGRSRADTSLDARGRARRNAPREA